MAPEDLRRPPEAPVGDPDGDGALPDMMDEVLVGVFEKRLSVVLGCEKQCLY